MGENYLQHMQDDSAKCSLSPQASEIGKSVRVQPVYTNPAAFESVVPIYPHHRVNRRTGSWEALL
jgi:hypothetical protein